MVIMGLWPPGQFCSKLKEILTEKLGVTCQFSVHPEVTMCVFENERVRW
jgi:hypothetical protein